LLVVEAASLERDRIVDIVRDAGVRVTEAASADAALGAVAASRLPDVLVTDTTLDRGGMDCPLLAAALRQRSPGLGVIYLAEHARGLNDDA